LGEERKKREEAEAKRREEEEKKIQGRTGKTSIRGRKGK